MRFSVLGLGTFTVGIGTETTVCSYKTITWEGFVFSCVAKGLPIHPNLKANKPLTPNLKPNSPWTHTAIAFTPA